MPVREVIKRSDPPSRRIPLRSAEADQAMARIPTAKACSDISEHEYIPLASAGAVVERDEWKTFNQKAPNVLSEKNSLNAPLIPATGFMRLSVVLKLYPVSRSTWYAGIKSGRYPSPVKLSESTSAWESAKIYQLIEDVKTAGSAS